MSAHGTPRPTGHDADADLDLLYAYWPHTQTPPPPCPEAAFSLCLRGTLQGHDAQLTIRGQTPEAFQAHVQAVRGLLDRPTPQAPQGRDQGAGWCPVHQVQMQWHAGKEGRKGWWSHQLGDGTWCQGR